MSDYATIDLGNGEIVETTPSFWNDPDRLRHAAQRLHALAAKANPYQLAPIEHDPFSVSDMVDGHVEDPAAAQEREIFFATERAKQQIMNALQQEEAEKALARQQEQAAFRVTPMGRLLDPRRY
jgi:hypothetical protein